ncbi:oxygenase MpaB family protein [Streptomyces sp. NPDC018045]|uniref:oxygenase MpaB family protein n=1 Tax=Streptomyces sp. NPDC018045 TaxID=3365037 RepID=UPI00378EC36C
MSADGAGGRAGVEPDAHCAAADSPDGGVGMPPAEAEAVYRRLVRHDLSEDLAFGLNIGFYRTFAVPQIAELLVATGKMTGQAEVRAKTTGLMMHQLFAAGLDSPRGAETVAALQRIHSRWQIGDDAFRYVLSCFDIAPMRWCDTYAWRATTAAEKAASHTFYRGLADRMGIPGVPATWDAFAGWTDRFERRQFAATAASATLWAATRGMLIRRFFPAPLGPFVRTAADALLDEPLRRAVGARRPSAPVRALVEGGMRLRARRNRRAHADPGYRPDLPPAVRDLA